MGNERWFLAQDQSSHWYIVNAANRTEWEAWCELPEDDETAWETPGYAERLNGGPGTVEFSDPEFLV